MPAPIPFAHPPLSEHPSDESLHQTNLTGNRKRQLTTSQLMLYVYTNESSNLNWDSQIRAVKDQLQVPTKAASSYNLLYRNSSPTLKHKLDHLKNKNATFPKPCSPKATPWVPSIGEALHHKAWYPNEEKVDEGLEQFQVDCNGGNWHPPKQ